MATNKPKGGILSGTDLSPNQGDVNSTGFGIPAAKAKMFGEIQFVGGTGEDKVPLDARPLKDIGALAKGFQSGGDVR